MRLSVIVPVYGVETYIARCAKSLLEQTYADKEIIFVDDASPDQSVAVLEEVLKDYPKESVTILHHAKNRGLAAARKTGLEAAKGEYVVSVDSDDYLEPEALTVLAAKAEETNADIIGMDCWFEWHDKRSVYRGKRAVDAKEYSNLLLSGATLPGVCLHMIRRELYGRANIWPIEGVNYGEDYVVTPRLCWFANRVAHVGQPLYHYTQTNASSYMHRVSTSNIKQLIQAVEVLTDFFADKPDCEESLRAGQWLKKTDLMMKVAPTDYALVNTMPCAMPLNIRTMTIPQRVAAYLIANHRWKLLAIYNKCFWSLMEGVQRLKGRRSKC